MNRQPAQLAPVIILRWTARLLGGMLVMLLLLFAIAGVLDPVQLTGAELALTVSLLVAGAGMLVLWRYESVGGFLVLAGMSAFYASQFLASGKLPAGWVFPLCFVPGVLALWAWMKGKRTLPEPH